MEKESVCRIICNSGAVLLSLSLKSQNVAGSLTLEDIYKNHKYDHQGYGSGSFRGSIAREWLC